MRKHFIVIIILIFFSSVLAGTEIFKEYNALPETNRVLLSWVTFSEQDIQYFRITRSNDDQASYIELDQISAQGPGYQYTYTDENVFFKSTGIVYYMIEAVNTSGSVVESTHAMFVHPSISGIHKTWGAIKNIFR